jgi:hypothetical protein
LYYAWQFNSSNNSLDFLGVEYNVAVPVNPWCWVQCCSSSKEGCSKSTREPPRRCTRDSNIMWLWSIGWRGGRRSSTRFVPQLFANSLSFCSIVGKSTVGCLHILWHPIMYKYRYRLHTIYQYQPPLILQTTAP